MAVKKATKKKVEFPKLSWGLEKLENWWEKNVPVNGYGDRPHFREDFPSFCQEDPVQFPGCCAFDVIEDLNYCKSKDFNEAIYLASACLQILDRGWDDVAPFVLATTIPRQKGEIATLRKIGFSPIKTVVNSNTNNRVTLWLASTRP